jgi:hypothetical protein
VVVEKSNLPFYQRLRKIRELIQPQVGLDIVVYTPEEFDQLQANSPFFREEIITKGKIIYEQSK